MEPSSKDNKLQNSADRIKKDLIVWLLNGGMNFDPEKDAIGNEVLFSQSRRRADLLILSEAFHALEIKGDSDRLEKLPKQIDDYRKTFDKVSVVTTIKHLRKIRGIVPRSIGIILVEDTRITVLRNPRVNQRLDKASLLMFFNQKMLVDLLQLKATRLYTGELRQVAIKKRGANIIREQAYNRLWETYSRLFRRFLKEAHGYPILIDEIRALSAEVSSSISFLESSGGE